MLTAHTTKEGVVRLDQTVFPTLQSGLQVAQELDATVAERQVKGDSFTLSLLVDIPHQDEPLPLDLIVARMTSTLKEQGHQLANGDIIIETTAKLESEGPEFKVSILLRSEQMKESGAEVFVSKDMERIILTQLSQAADQLLREE